MTAVSFKCKNYLIIVFFLLLSGKHSVSHRWDFVKLMVGAQTVKGVLGGFLPEKKKKMHVSKFEVEVWCAFYLCKRDYVFAIFYLLVDWQDNSKVTDEFELNFQVVNQLDIDSDSDHCLDAGFIFEGYLLRLIQTSLFVISQNVQPWQRFVLSDCFLVKYTVLCKILRPPPALLFYQRFNDSHLFFISLFIKKLLDVYKIKRCNFENKMTSTGKSQYLVWRSFVLRTSWTLLQCLSSSFVKGLVCEN